MSRFFLAFIVPFIIIETIVAKSIVDCRVVTGGTTDCNQYGSKLLRAKEISYDIDTKKLIISKTLPVPEKERVKVISVSDMIEKYVKVEDSLRFKWSERESLHINVIKETVPKDKIKKIIDRIDTQKDTYDEIVTPQNLKNLHTLQSLKPKKTHTLRNMLGFYTIKKGDTLIKVAHKFSISQGRLRLHNNLTQSSTIKVGKKFKIPLSQKMIDTINNAEYSIKEGDTLLSIAHKFKILPKDLVKYNHIKSNTVIKKGKKLVLPFPHYIKRVEAVKKSMLSKKTAEKKRRLAKQKAVRQKVKMIRGFGKKKLRVTATAYTSHRNQTDKTPFLAAWNNRLRPGMKIIAVSRDLITRYGLRNGSRVRIGGLKGYYLVRDKMNKRYRKRIDIYMGMNKRRALRWGRRSVVIYW